MELFKLRFSGINVYKACALIIAFNIVFMMLCGMALTKLDVANLARKSTAQMYPEVPPQFDDPDYHPDYGPPPHQRIGYDPMRRSLEEGLESKNSVDVDCFYTDTMIQGYEVGKKLISGVANALECQRACQEEVDCRFFTFGTAESSCPNCCYFKSSDLGRESSNGYISGPWSCGFENEESHCWENDVYYEGQHVSLMEQVDTMEQCRQHCLDRDDCEGYVLNSRESNRGPNINCYAKTKIVTKRYYPGIRSAGRDCSPSHWGKKFELPPQKEIKRSYEGHLNLDVIDVVSRQGCKRIPNVCFYKGKTYVAPEDRSKFEPLWLEYIMTQRLGGHKKYNTNQTLLNVTVYHSEAEFQRMRKAFLQHYTPFFFIQDFPEMFYEMWQTTIRNIADWQRQRWMDKNFAMILMYPFGRQMQNMWPILLRPFTNFNIYSWEDFFSKLYYKPGACFNSAVFCKMPQTVSPPPPGIHRNLADEVLTYYHATFDDRSKEKLIVAIVDRQSRRKILNIQPILYKCEQELKYDCMLFNMESMTPSLFAELRKIHVFVYMHGSAGINGLFVPKGSTVVEIMPWAAPHFTIHLFPKWIFAGTGTHMERLFVLNKTFATFIEPERWQAANQYVEWEHIGGAIQRAAHHTQLQMGMTAEFSSEAWRGTYDRKLNPYMTVIQNLYISEGKWYTTSKVAAIPHGDDPPESCAQFWTPLIFELETFTNLYDLFMNVILVLHTFRERKLLSSRFGIIFISSIEKVPEWILESLALLVNLEIMTKSEFVNQEKLPFTCISQALLVDAAALNMDNFTTDDIRDCLKFVRGGMLAHYWAWDDPRRDDHSLVHFARDANKALWSNWDEIQEMCVDLHLYCHWWYYDELSREVLFALVKVNVFVFDHSHLGLHSMFFHPGTAIVEIAHSDAHSNVPSHQYEEWTKDQEVNYYRYVSSTTTYPDDGYELDIDRFREVFQEATGKARSYIKHRPTMSFNKAVTHNRHSQDVIDKTLKRVEDEQIEGYEVKKFYGNPELTYENFTGTIYPPTTKKPIQSSKKSKSSS